MTEDSRADTQSASSALSHVVHRLGAVTAGEHVAFVMAFVVSVWLVAYALAGFPGWMATVLEVAAASVTLVMVFVIQHTQQRVVAATQLKLDELVRVSEADDEVAEIEHTGGDELDRQRERRSTGTRRRERQRPNEARGW